MRTTLALLVMSGTALAERPPTSATAAADNLIEDLIAKRYDAAAKGLAKQVSLRNLEFRGACKKAFPKDTGPNTIAFAKCLASDVAWPDARIVATEIKTPLGWRVEFGDTKFNVRRTRDKKGYEVFSIVLPGFSDR